MSSAPAFRFGFDIGGTFTDFVLLDETTGELHTFKTLTTPENPSEAVIEGWNELLKRVGGEGSAVQLCIHGTTLITNALIQRNGARTALLTTAGFGDTLDTQREMRYDIYDLHSPPVEPLVPRPLRCEVDERLDSFGEVVTPLTDHGLEQLAAFVERVRPQAAAVCLLHAYRNPEHEQRVGSFLQQRFPALALSLSSAVAPEIREYERMSTTVANAYVQPLSQRYLLTLEQALQQRGYGRELYLMLSSGGITVADTAARFPIRLVESGPAAGALAACFFGAGTGNADLVAFDMGGTTAKLCVITNGQPLMTHSFEIARRHRFKRGSGLPIKIPAIELIEIGAGGGSIARVDELGLLKVGPESAGAVPGPACYGAGGTQATVTDANLLLGYLDAGYFLGGRMRLDRAAAERAVAPLAEALGGLSVTETAVGIHRVVNESMISATRVHVAERGIDPRTVVLMAFGGAGPAHADAIARALKMRGYIIPATAGVASALGFLTAPIAFDLARTQAGRVGHERLAELDAVVAELAEEGRATLARAGVAGDDMKFEVSLDLRHVGQGHEITVALGQGTLAHNGLPALRSAFDRAYEAIYGYAHHHLDLEIMTVRLRATGSVPRLELARLEQGGPAQAVHGRRAVWVGAWGNIADVAVYRRAELGAGAVLHGPAVVEDSDATAVLGPDTTATMDPLGNLVVLFDVERKGQSRS